MVELGNKKYMQELGWEMSVKKALGSRVRRRNFFAYLKTSKIPGFHGSEH